MPSGTAATHLVTERIHLDLKALAPALADASMPRLVRTKLLGNGIRFTQPREVALVEVDSVAEGSEIIYRVRDNGVGFEPACEHTPLGVLKGLRGVDGFGGTGIGRVVATGRHGVVTTLCPN